MPVSAPSSTAIRRFQNKQGASRRQVIAEPPEAFRAATSRGGPSQSLLNTERTVPVRLAQPSSARRQTRAANDPASAEQRDEGRTCDRERGRRKGGEQADAADDPIPREERRADPLLLRERERGVVRDEVP